MNVSSAPYSRAQAVAGIAAGMVAVPQFVRAQTLEKVRMSAVPLDDMTPVYWAIKAGYYQKAGIDLEVVPVASGSASTAAVIAGAYELGKASPIASMLAHLRGLPITIVANSAMVLARTPFGGMLVAADSPIKTAPDCNGKIGASPGLNDISALAMTNWIDKNGGDIKTVKWVELTPTAFAPAIYEHRIDFANISEPLLSAALETGKLRVLANAFGSVSDRWLGAAYVARPDWANKNPDVVKRFAAVTYEAAAYINTHKPETVAMMSEATKIPAALFAKMVRIEGATSSDPRLLEPLIDLAVRYKVIPNRFPASDLYWHG
jgi:NitT/TauT family transport system substrate-binding protein